MRKMVLIAAVAVAGCATQTNELSDVTAERDALRERNAVLEQELADARAATKAADAAADAKVAERTAAKAQPFRPAVSNPYEAARAWVADALQVTDAGKREAAIASIREALASDDAARVAAGLVAVPQIAKVSYDKSPMRELVLRHAKSADAAVRTAFPFAFLNAGPTQPGDVDVVLPLTSDPEARVRDNAGRSLVFFTKYDLTGPAGERVLALLDDPDRQVRRDVLGSIWGSRVSPGIEAKLLAMFASEDHQVRHEAFYFGLSTLKDKSPAVVDACIEAMESADGELQWRARWGLRQGVPEDQRGKVGDSYLRLLAARSDSRVEEDGFQWLTHYGNESQAAELDKIAQNPLASDSAKKGATSAAEAIRRAR